MIVGVSLFVPLVCPSATKRRILVRVKKKKYTFTKKRDTNKKKKIKVHHTQLPQDQIAYERRRLHIWITIFIAAINCM